MMIYTTEKLLINDGEFINYIAENFKKCFNIDEVTLTSQLMTSYRKMNIASEKIINYRVISQ